MKNTLVVISALIGIGGFNGVFAEDEKMPMRHHHQETSVLDARIPLNVSPEMKRNQLSNMRGHVESINSIVGLMSENKFDEASKVAHSKLGLSAEMQAMCGMFNDENFEKLGLAFHKSGDDLGDALQTKDIYASLRALNKTTQICVTCHATYRQ